MKLLQSELSNTNITLGKEIPSTWKKHKQALLEGFCRIKKENIR